MRYAALTGALMMSLGLVVPASEAQQPQARPEAPPNVAEPQPDLPDPAHQRDGPVTLSGCLGRADATADSSPLTLVVNPGASRDAGTRVRATRYRVVASRSDVDLLPHVGHQVTLAGKLQTDAIGSGDATAPEATEEMVPPTVPSGSTGVDTIPDPPHANDGAAAHATTMNATLVVESIEMVSGTCRITPGS
jgi:hypothetical protein